MTTHTVLDKIRTDIILAGRDSRYPLEAYGFVLGGLDFYRTKIGERRHVTGQELSRALAEFAAAQFGPMACDVLKRWGIRTTADFGYIVYNMIDIHVMHKQESDSLEDFFNVFDLYGCLQSRDFFIIDKKCVKNIDGA